MYLPTVIVAFVVLTLVMSLIYFYMFARSQEQFIKFFGLCWVCYSLSLLFLILYMGNHEIYFLGLRKIFDMLNILFLLFSAYAFMHIHIPSYWYRFSLYMIIWIVIGTYYQFDLLSIFLPIAMYQVIITFTLCFIVITYWDVPNIEKALSLLVFILWGMGKATLSICEVGYSNLASLYLMEIIFSNILNFCIFIIYLHKTRSVIDMADRLYRIIAENATDVIFYYKLIPQPAFVYITPSVEEMTGYIPKVFVVD